MNTRKAPLWPLALLLVLAAASAVNAYFTLIDYGIVQAKRAFRTAGYSSWDRSALSLLGNRGWEYMRFLRAVVPSTSPIVLPTGAEWSSQQNILQFFLMPRGIPSCSGEGPSASGSATAFSDCIRKPAHFVPAIGSFPPIAAISDAKKLVPFPGEASWYHGVYAPQEFTPPPNPLPPPTELTPARLAVSGSLNTGILLALLVLGVLLARAFLGPHFNLDVVALAFPLGVGALTWWTFLVSLARTGRIDLLSYAIAFIVLCAIAFLARVVLRTPARKTVANPPQRTNGIERPALALSVLGVVTLFSLSLVISVGRAYSSYDEIANWALKGYAIADFNTIYAGSDWGGHGLAYPQNLAILISLFRLSDGDLLALSKAAFPMFMFSLCTGSAAFLVRRGLPPAIIGVSILALLATPVLFAHSTLAFANLPFATYTVLGTLHFIDGIPPNSIRQLSLGSLLLGFAAWTRPEGIGFGVIVILLLIAIALISRKVTRVILLSTIPFFVISVPWLAFAYRYIRSDEVGQTLGGMFSSLASGSINTASPPLLMRYSAAHLADPHTWGLTIATALIVLFFALPGIRRSRGFEVVATCLSALLLIALPLLMFYAASYTKPDLVSFLDVSFDRALFPGITLLLLAALALLGERSNPPLQAA